MHDTDTLKQLLATPKKVLILPHCKPDADALGACLALRKLLVQIGHSATVISPTNYPHFLFWMHAQEKTIVYSPENEAKIAKYFDEARLIFCLDFSSLKRIENLAPYLRKAIGKSKIVLIDHHRGKEDFADFEFWDINASSASELLYDFMEKMGYSERIDEHIGECLYAGIMTDSGSFKYPTTTGKTHRIVAKLKDKGINTSRIHRLIFDTNSLNRLRFLGFALSEKLTVMPDFHTAYFALSRQELEKFDARTGDTEGIVNYALSLENVILAGFFTAQKTGGTKISFRSAGSFSVARLAEKHFNGGGHINAAGAVVDKSLTETVAAFKELLPAYQKELVSVFQEKTAK